MRVEQVGAAVRVLVMIGRILEQITYMLRPGQVERTQSIDWLNGGRRRGGAGSVPCLPNEAEDEREGKIVSEHHRVENRE